MKVSLVNVVIGFVVLVIAVLAISGRAVPEGIKDVKIELATQIPVRANVPTRITVPTPMPLLEDHPLLEKVRNRLFDAQSARFRNLVLDPNGGICGEVNAKNRYGAYVGFDPFFITEDTVHLLSEPAIIDIPGSQAVMFLYRADEAWMRQCVCKATPYMCP